MKKIHLPAVFGFLLFYALFPSLARAADSVIRLRAGESRVLQVESVQKVAVGNPAIAEATAVSDQEILLSGKSPGNTSLLFVSADGEKKTREIVVSSMNRKGSMVEIGVEIMEIETNSALKAGLNWNTTGKYDLSGTVNIHDSPLAGSPPSLLSYSSFAQWALDANLQLLIDRGKAKILAKPKLLAVSGEEASFLAGGEIPYVVESKLGSPTVEWKPYGVKLVVKPTLDEQGNISGRLRAEVSGVDPQNGVAMGTTVVPALRTRWVETTVYMKGGDTLVIAGPIEDEDQKFTSGLPLISDIPILGELFRFTSTSRKQTELVIFVTPSQVGQTPGE